MTRRSKCSHPLHQGCEHSLRFSSCLVVAEPRIENWLFACLPTQTIPQRFGHLGQSMIALHYDGAVCTHFLLGCALLPDMSSWLNSWTQQLPKVRIQSLLNSSIH